MTVPRPLSQLPLASIAAVAVTKLVVMPIIGVALQFGLVKGGLVAEDAKVLVRPGAGAPLGWTC